MSVTSVAEVVAQIGPPDAGAARRALERLDRLTKPPGSLGRLEELSVKLAGIFGSERPRFDQQPIDTMCLVEACADAFRATGQDKWYQHARRCLAWFKGRNDLNVTLCDFKIGGCSDGLMPHGPNRNMGAESTLAWLISLLTMHELATTEVTHENTPQLN